MKVAYLGPNGSFSEIVFLQRFKNYIPYPQKNIKDIFEKIRKNNDIIGIVPVENSFFGNIYETIDELIDPSFNLEILEEINLKINIYLIGNNLLNSKYVQSHVVQLNTYKDWLKNNYPHLIQISVNSTSEACRCASEDNNYLALGSKRSSEIYKLNILDILPSENNITQFFIIGKLK